MKIHLKMPEGLEYNFERELEVSQAYFERKEFLLSWYHLERAHILGQAWPVQHTKAHWKMLVFAFKIKNRKEIFGQIPRLLVGGIKSFIGEIPVGNTGGSNVPPLKSMQIPNDLKTILDKYLKS